MEGSIFFTNICANVDSEAVDAAHNCPKQREHMISIEAYFLAEKRGFAPNQELADWLEAEHEVDSHLVSFSA